MSIFPKVNIKNSHKLLSWSLLAGGIYFFLICVAHLFGLKIPILFIYFNVPSYIYQDMIISFLAFGFGMFFYAGYSSVKRNELITTKYIIIAGFGAVIGLMNINFFTDFNYFEAEFKLKISLVNFWSETIFVFLYVLWLQILYISALNSNKKKESNKEVKSLFDVANDEQKKFRKYR
ncbi:MAG: hypothetical protein KKF62_05970 [Bacteroidetes bacterium]|nr:hypothetical protein [Bacteroidota bacterium]MBU1116259.1 hypothetical protein [Bacteroidota bacterium]MBU1799757.1 hypothetical protein [Bacteroidota bacterium]